jgi:hypothetical protein
MTPHKKIFSSGHSDSGQGDATGILKAKSLVCTKQDVSSEKSRWLIDLIFEGKKDRLRTQNARLFELILHTISNTAWCDPFNPLNLAPSYLIVPLESRIHLGSGGSWGLLLEGSRLTNSQMIKPGTNMLLPFLFQGQLSSFYNLFPCEFRYNLPGGRRGNFHAHVFS